MKPVFRISDARYAVFPPGAAQASSTFMPGLALQALHTSIALSLCTVSMPSLNKLVAVASNPLLGIIAFGSSFPNSKVMSLYSLTAFNLAITSSLVYGYCALKVICVLADASIFSVNSLPYWDRYSSARNLGMPNLTCKYSLSSSGSAGSESLSLSILRSTPFTKPARPDFPISFVSFTLSFITAYGAVFIIKSSAIPIRRMSLMLPCIRPFTKCASR